MFERFADTSRRVLVLAQEEARLLGHGFIGTEHILLGIIQLREGPAVVALHSLGVDLESVRSRVAEIGGASRASIDAPQFTLRARRVLELALREALQVGARTIEPEHMLLGLLREGEGGAVTTLEAMGADAPTLRVRVDEALRGVRTLADEPLAAVDGSQVEKTDFPLDATALFAWSDAAGLLADLLVGDARTVRRTGHQVDYLTCTYRPQPLPVITVAVAGAEVTRKAFDAYRSEIGDARSVDGLGDAATYSQSKGSLRVLTGTILFVVHVSHHTHALEVATGVARRALANIERRTG
jgi:hypothetical protein